MNQTAFIHQELQRIDAQAQSQASQVRQARRIEDVLRLNDIHPAAWLRPLVRTLSGMRALERAVRDRLQTLVQEQLQQVRQLPPLEREAALKSLEQGDWQRLRGPHAQTLGWALRESARLRHEAIRLIRGTPPPVSAPEGSSPRTF